MSRPHRGVLYLTWGDRHPALVERSIRSLRMIYPDMPVHVHTLPPEASLLEKAVMFDVSPFEQTLYLDADTEVLDDLDFGFDRAARFGLACCICECPWARRFGGLSGDITEYNTGVLFFSRSARPLFDAWKYWAARLDSSIQFQDMEGTLQTRPTNDQASFARAIADTGYNPWVLPLNWNFRPTWHHTFHGPIKVWHDYGEVPTAIREINENQRNDQKIINFYKLK